MLSKFSLSRFGFGRLGALTRDERGAVIIVVALVLPAMLGAVALAAEYGNSLVVKAENQRIADLASYAGALAYMEDESETDMEAAAVRIAALNGIAAADVDAVLTTSPTDVDLEAVHVTISTEGDILLAPLLGVSDLVSITSDAFTAFSEGEAQAGCILALNAAQTGITLSGGTSITATGCAVASNASLTVPCGTTITSPLVNWDTVAPTIGCSGGIPGSVSKATTIDPIVDNPGKITAVARLTTVSAQTAPTAPTAPTMPTVPAGTNLTFNSSTVAAMNTAVLAATANGCGATKVGSMWTMTCVKGTPAKVYNLGTVTISGGQNLTITTAGVGTATINIKNAMTVNSGQTFNMQGGTGTTYNFGNTFTTSGTTTATANGTYNFVGNFTHGGGTNTLNAGTYKFGGNVTAQSSGTFNVGAGTYNIGGEIFVSGSAAATFGAGTYNVVRGIRATGGNSPTFGAGTYNLGQSLTTCATGVGTVSLCNSTTHISFAGPSTFSFVAGIYVGGGSRLTMGSGTTNSFNIGPSSVGHSLNTAGGSKVFFGDATLFQMGGNLNSPSGGGSCLRLPVTAQHDIKGYFNVAGGIWMGAGVYTLTGYMHMGASGGGSVDCSVLGLGTISVRALGVTIVLGGASVPTTGSAANTAFYASAGYSGIQITAPTSGTTEDLAIIGPTVSTNTNGVLLGGGASGGQYTGAFYFPYGPITVNGGAGASGGGSCMQLIGSRITISGGAVLGTACDTTGGASSESMIALVQ